MAKCNVGSLTGSQHREMFMEKLVKFAVEAFCFVDCMVAMGNDKWENPNEGCPGNLYFLNCSLAI